MSKNVYLPLGTGLIADTEVDGLLGEPGAVILTRAHPDKPIVYLHVLIHDILGLPFESGHARWDAKTEAWTYRTIVAAPSDQIVIVLLTAVARDAMTFRKLVGMPDLYGPGSSFEHALDWAEFYRPTWSEN